jgi:hypothetical protein
MASNHLEIEYKTLLGFYKFQGGIGVGEEERGISKFCSFEIFGHLMTLG